jgi:hypothetical protein
LFVVPKEKRNPKKGKERRKKLQRFIQKIIGPVIKRGYGGRLQIDRKRQKGVGSLQKWYKEQTRVNQINRK